MGLEPFHSERVASSLSTVWKITLSTQKSNFRTGTHAHSSHILLFVDILHSPPRHPSTDCISPSAKVSPRFSNGRPYHSGLPDSCGARRGRGEGADHSRESTAAPNNRGPIPSSPRSSAARLASRLSIECLPGAPHSFMTHNNHANIRSSDWLCH